MEDYKQYSIREAQKDDLQTIVDIYNSTIASRIATADLNPVSLNNKEEWFNRHNPDLRPLWVLVRVNDHRICGWLSFESFYGRPAYHATAEISIYLDKEFRGKGLGSYLLQQAIDASPKLGLKTLLAYIFGHNIPSLALFHSMGFLNWGHLPRIAELDGVERDLVILGKRI